MFLVIWNDWEGLQRERAFDTLEDAQLEAQALEASDTVEYIYPIREVSGDELLCNPKQGPPLGHHLDHLDQPAVSHAGGS